ncbi:hypothetical protein [Pandoraea iniqua]|uniref:hypothetical protein n=1 Tax=Pandoraea iniqua TaxID=2508288 RepID=UPI001240F933|nr:hypothetical protein [Pandoraea iniqua]
MSDIAGNQSDILVSAWARDDAMLPDGDWKVLFGQPMANPARTCRVALLMPVDRLSSFLINAPTLGLTTEHVYDF